MSSLYLESITSCYVQGLLLKSYHWGQLAKLQQLLFPLFSDIIYKKNKKWFTRNKSIATVGLKVLPNIVQQLIGAAFLREMLNLFNLFVITKNTEYQYQYLQQPCVCSEWLCVSDFHSFCAINGHREAGLGNRKKDDKFR